LGSFSYVPTKPAELMIKKWDLRPRIVVLALSRPKQHGLPPPNEPTSLIIS